MPLSRRCSLTEGASCSETRNTTPSNTAANTIQRRAHKDARAVPLCVGDAVRRIAFRLSPCATDLYYTAGQKRAA